MKVTIFNGSPRGRKSNSHIIAESILKGAAKAGADTEEVFLIEKDIKQCRGCFDCWGKTPGICSIRDEMAELIEKFLGSDYAGMATPVYGMLMTALLKNFTDRFLPLATPHIRRNQDGSFYHDGRVKRFPGQFYIANSGFPGENNFDMLKAYMQLQHFVLEIYRNCGEALQPTETEKPEIVDSVNNFKQLLEQAGEQMVLNGTVCDKLLDKIHAPLISDEEYMEQANKQWDEQLGKNGR